MTNKLLVLVVLLTISVSASLFAQKPMAVAPIDSDSDGVYEIKNVGNIEFLSQELYGSTWLTYDYILLNDIDLVDYYNYNFSQSNVGTEFTPIQTFKGTFDGQGYSIFNLNIINNTIFSGFFGSIVGTSTDRAVVKNLGIELLKISIAIDANDYDNPINTDYIGGLAGFAHYADFEFCWTSGDISGFRYVGGLFGEINNVTVEECFTWATVSGNRYVGGLIGVADANPEIRNSFVNGTIKGIEWETKNPPNPTTYEPPMWIAGFVAAAQMNTLIEDCFAEGNIDVATAISTVAGFAISSEDYTTIKNCYSHVKNTGTVKYTGAGFIVAINDNSVIENCYSKTIFFNEDYGFNASIDANATVNSCYYNSTYIDSESGVPLNSTSFIIQSSFLGWDFINTWTIDTELARNHHNSSPILKSCNPNMPIDPVLSMSLPDGIRNIEEIYNLYWLSKHQTSNSMKWDYHVESNLYIDGDITDWEPIGTNLQPFLGLFDANIPTKSGEKYFIKHLQIHNSYDNNVGLFGVNNGNIKNVWMIGVEIFGMDNVGVLCGINNGNISDVIINSFTSLGMKGSVRGHNNTGIIIGKNTGTITDCMIDLSTHNDANIYKLYARYENFGGICGKNEGTITNCDVSAIEILPASVDYGPENIGGIAGFNDGIATITDCNVSDITLTGDAAIGGLVGANSSTVTSSNVLRTNLYGHFVGGFCGANGGTINDCIVEDIVTNYATILPYNGTIVGGFVGLNTNGIYDCEVKDSDVAGFETIGGFVGQNAGHIHESFVDDDSGVYGDLQIGGFVGQAIDGLIEQSATKASVRSWASDCGGFVGMLGDLVQTNDPEIKNCYAKGNVQGVANVGGFIGNMYNSSVSFCYSTGAVLYTTTYGGFLACSTGTNIINEIYWDTQTSGVTYSVAGVGYSTLMMQDPYLFYLWDFVNIWESDLNINDGYFSFVDAISIPYKRNLNFGTQTRVSLYPNPAPLGTSINLNIEISTLENYTVKIYDLNGNLISYANNTKEIPLTNDYNRGTYMLIIESNGSIISRNKFIVK